MYSIKGQVTANKAEKASKIIEELYKFQPALYLPFFPACMNVSLVWHLSALICFSTAVQLEARAREDREAQNAKVDAHSTCEFEKSLRRQSEASSDVKTDYHH